MTTIQDLLQQATQQFKAIGIETAALDARFLMEHCLQKDHTFITLNAHMHLPPDRINAFENMIKRRLTREPIAKIIGEKDFWDLTFKTTKDTLDPRPDSEVLIEQVLDIHKEPDTSLAILDLGTGTGCLILTLLNHYKNATGTAVDFSKAALNVAKENAEKHHLTARCTFLESNWFEKVTGTYDLIISNPPYIPETDLNSLKADALFDPKDALSPKKDYDGLSCYRHMAKDITHFLKPNGYALFEFGQNQHEDVKKIFESAGLTFVSFRKDLSGIIRCALFQKANN